MCVCVCVEEKETSLLYVFVTAYWSLPILGLSVSLKKIIRIFAQDSFNSSDLGTCKDFDESMLLYEAYNARCRLN